MKKIILFLILFSPIIFSQIAPEWETTYSINNNSSLTVLKILTDENNNFFYLAKSNNDTALSFGGFTFLAKFDPAGTLLWRRTFSRPGVDSGDFPVTMVKDNQNNIFILENSKGYNTGPDFAVIKYDQNGNFLWDYYYTSFTDINSYDYPEAIALDNNSNVIITGSTRLGFVNDSLLTIKLNNSGGFIWKKTYARTRTRENSGKCILINNNNEIYIGGSVNDSLNGFINALLLKYNSSGDILWQQTYNYSQSFDDFIFDMTTDNNGDIITTGGAGGFFSLDSSNVLIQKYSQTGAAIWTQVLYIPNPSSEYGIKIKIDNNNNIFILGRNSQNPNFRTILLFKYNPSGTLQWYKQHGVFTSEPAFGNYITFDDNYDVLICGNQYKYSRNNLLILKYRNIDGSLYWNYFYNTPGYSYNSAFYISALQDGKFITAGNVANNTNLLNTIKFQPTNSYTYTFRRDNLNKPVLDSQYTYDTVLLSTDQLPPEAYIRYINIKIDTLLHSAMGDIEITLKNGAIEDTLFYRRGGTLDNMIRTNLNDTSAFDICNNGLPPFSGFFAPCKSLSKHLFRPGSGPWIIKIYDRKAPDTGILKSWELKLSYEIPIGISPISNEVPKVYSLYQNYPNPFNPVTKIKFSIPEPSITKLIVYDINGKEIQTIFDDWLNPGIYESEFNASQFASGVFFYKLTTNNFSETKKMVLIK